MWISPDVVSTSALELERRCIVKIGFRAESVATLQLGQSEEIVHPWILAALRDGRIQVLASLLQTTRIESVYTIAVKFTLGAPPRSWSRRWRSVRSAREEKEEQKNKSTDNDVDQ